MEKVMTGHCEHWALEKDPENIYWLTLDRADSSANSLNEPVLREFSQILNNLSQNKEAKALVIQSKKKTGFILGADIHQFEHFENAQQATDLIRQGQEIFDALENLPFTTIARIEGMCLGGGLELALACDYRIVDDRPTTRLGLPEVKLGIHPGWGGTIRLPKLIGVMGAMDLILSGRTLVPKVAKKMGVVDHVTSIRLMEKVARAYALNPPKKHAPKWWQRLTNFRGLSGPLSHLFYRQLNKKICQEHYPAPYAVVKNWKEFGTDSPNSMMEEAKSIGHLFLSDTSKNLVRIFFLQEKLKGLAKRSTFKATHLHVVGAGIMGGDIAAYAAVKGLTVSLQDMTPALLGSAVKRTHQLAKKRLKAPHLVRAAVDRLLPDPQGIGVKKADIIIEAITEKLEAKQQLFKSLEENARKDAILATNTSTIPLEDISTCLSEPGRLVGIHYFNPVPLMPLVEIVKGDQTYQEVVDKAFSFVKGIGKLPLPVKSAPGFLVNRILLPYMLEAVSLLEEGLNGPTIDKVARDFGMPMGPIELADKVGLDVCLAALENLSEYLGGEIPQALRDRVNEGHLGCKTSKGFYEYTAKGKRKKTQDKVELTASQDIQDRLILRLLNEAVACYREKIVDDLDYIDAGAIFGIGFPPFRGGPIAYVKKQGEQRLLEQLNDLKIRYGDRFLADEGWNELDVA